MATRYYMLSDSWSAGSYYPTTEQSPDSAAAAASPADIAVPPRKFSLISSAGPPGTTMSASSANLTIAPYAIGHKAPFSAYWLSPALAAATYAGGTFAPYWARHTVLGAPPPVHAPRTESRIHIYLWRPGTGKVATLYGPISDPSSIPPTSLTDVSGPGLAGYYAYKPGTFAYSGFTTLSGDRIVMELWAEAIIDTPSHGADHHVWFNGTDTGYTHNQFFVDSGPLPDPASYVEFSETFAEATGTTHDIAASVTGIGTTNASSSLIAAVDASIYGISSTSGSMVLNAFLRAFSDYLETKLVDLIFQATSFSTLSNIYVSLHMMSPLDSAVGTEVSGGSYARVPVSTSGGWTATYTNGELKSTNNMATITFPSATAPWGNITHFGLWDAVSGGNLLFHGQLISPKTIGSGDTIKFLANQLMVGIGQSYDGWDPYIGGGG